MSRMLSADRLLADVVHLDEGFGWTSWPAAARNAWRRQRGRRAGARISADGVTIDARSTVAERAQVHHHASLLDSTVGRFSLVGRYSKVAFTDVGAFCSISWDVSLGASRHCLDTATTHNFTTWPTYGFAAALDDSERERLVIGCDVWVGCHAVVMPGIRVGHGAVIGSGAVVTKNVPDFHIVAGVPARVVRSRFPDPIAERLLRVAWWNWPIPALHEHEALFRQPLNEEVLDRLEAVPTPAVAPHRPPFRPATSLGGRR